MKRLKFDNLEFEPVQKYFLRRVCDCGNGYLNTTNDVRTDEERKIQIFEHKCIGGPNACGETFWLDKAFPRVEENFVERWEEIFTKFKQEEAAKEKEEKAKAKEEKQTKESE